MTRLTIFASQVAMLRLFARKVAIVRLTMCVRQFAWIRLFARLVARLIFFAKQVARPR